MIDVSMSAEVSRALFEDSADGLFVADASGRCVSANQRAADLTGYAREALIGMALADLVVPEDLAPKDWVLRRQDGTRLPVDVSARMLPDRHRLQIVRDASERKRVEDALRFRDEAIESSNNGIAFADMAGRLTSVNPSFVRMWGYRDAGEMVGRHISEFGSSAEDARQVVVTLLEKGWWVGETTAQKKNGEPFIVEMSSSLVRDVKGTPIAMMGSFIDATKRKRAEAALQESEEKYRSLVESAQDPIFTSDANGRYLYVNAAAATQLGTTPEQLMGRTVDDLFPPHIAERYRATVGRVMQTGETLVTEDKSEINGQTVWFSNVMQPVRDRHGDIKAVQAVVRDVTSFKRVESALRESEERLRQAIRVSHIGIFDHDHLTGTIHQSPELREIYGLEAGEEPGGSVQTDPNDPMTLSTVVHLEDRGRIAAAIQRAHDPAGDGVYEVEHRHIREDGTVRWLTTRAQTFFEGAGDMRHAVRTLGAVGDITERKHAEFEHDKLQSQLVQAQKMESVGRLAGGVAHDFNNMLSVISGYAEMALDRIDPALPLHGEILEIQKAAKRSADLTRQLLAFARRQTVTPKVLNLNDVVAGSLNMLRRLIGEDINLVWIPGHDLQAVRIDLSQVDQILANLSANARDAIANSGRVTILTENAELDDAYCALHTGAVPGEYVMLEVTDDGRGMDLETQAHVFEPFYTTKGEGLGTGLGLATVYGIVKQNDGFLDVESEVGRGTAVRLYLPRFAGAAITAADGPAEPPKTGTETILLVEDEPMVLQVSKALLERLGYTVLFARGPNEAIRLADEHAGRIQLLVTDAVMPEMNGQDLAARLTSSYPRLKCVLMSGYFASAITSRALADGAHFLQKPFTAHALASKIREALDEKEP